MAVRRRQILHGGAAAAMLALAGCRLPIGKGGPLDKEHPMPEPFDPTTAIDRIFPNSVASGDPTPTGAIVWTRLAPEAHARGGELVLEVASDPEMADVVVEQAIAPDRLGAVHDWTVREDLDGRLLPDRHFYYRFVYDGVASRIGRLRTLPAADTAVERLRLGVLSCQDYTRGYFNAFAELAAEDLEYLLHLGDFVYETLPPLPVHGERWFELPSGQPVAMGLGDFRTIHRTYRSDPMLQRALERHTLIAIWDDHEIANDRYWDAEESRPRGPDHPLDADALTSGIMTAGGIRAWYEYMPARVRYDATSTSLRDRIRVERSFRFGSLAEIYLTDGRLRRDAHPCGEARADRFNRAAAICPGRTARGRSMLDDAQRRWLVDGLASSTAQWKLWGNSVPLTSVGYGFGAERIFLTLDTWAGFAAERRTILGELRRRGVENLVSLAGDMHTFFAADLHLDEPRSSRRPANALGVELAFGAVTAPSLESLVGPLCEEDLVRKSNPQIALWKPGVQGAAILELRRDALECEIRACPVEAPARNPAQQVAGRVRVRSGVSEIEVV